MKFDVTSTFQTPMSRKPKLFPKPQSCHDVSIKDPVSVFCRIRPLDDPGEDVFAVAVNSRRIKLCPPVSSFAFRNGTAKEQEFTFSHVFSHDSSQKQVFYEVAEPLVKDLLQGKNGLLFIYGITGSGKTYTMEGSRSNAGLVSRTIDIVFNSIGEFQAMKYIFKPDKMNGFEIQTEADAMLDKQKLDIFPSLLNKNKKNVRREHTNGSQESSERIPDTSRVVRVNEDNAYAVFVTYIEIYNNYIYDLLEEFSETNMVKDLQSKILREDARHNMYVHGCTEVEVKSPEEALEVLAKGQKRRKVAHTRLNCESSRSHSVFTVRVVQVPLDSNGDAPLCDKSAMVVSQLSMVDLAGSERNNRTQATGGRLKEAGNINNSLMALRQCIETMRTNQKSSTSQIVPYRKSKLTHYFKNYFEGEGKVFMIVCVNPRSDDYDETLPVMKFAELASEVQIHRPVSAFRPDYGFTPGRRKANIVFKEARRRLHEEGMKPKELETVDITPVFSLGPALPSVVFNTPEEFEEVTQKLVTCLRKNLSNMDKFTGDLKDLELRVRGRISETEKENLVARQEVGSLRSLYEDAMKKVFYYESLLLSAEAANDSLHKKFSDYNVLMDEYKQACEERDMAKSHGQIEKQKMKAKLKVRLETERNKMVQEMNSKLREQKDQLKTQMFNTQVKALQDMYGSDKQLPQGAILPPSNPTTVKPIKINVPSQTGPPSTNTRHHRRSLSQGANVASVWVDHRPDQVTVDATSTVLQPNLPRGRSVRCLRSGDLLDSKKVTNCCLTTQGKDSSGEIETKMYKGDVLPTVGGGAQVVFQDVEILKQRDPLDMPSAKRGADGAPKVALQTLQNRCTSGVQGLGITPKHNYTHNKRPRKL